MKLKKISTGKLRPYKINIGLRRGYDKTAKTHTQEDVVRIATNHLKDRADKGLTFLTGTVLCGEVCYAWPTKSGLAQSDNEPMAMYVGNVSPLYNSNISDDEVLSILIMMAEDFAEQLGQVRIYIEYLDQLYIFQDEDAGHPNK